ncbi:MAG: class I SAM-dependent methyltransferase [Planctomycetes bacterium]|nr:class I SAM-dependent methyltransferase [Planctomycetota bacterium]
MSLSHVLPALTSQVPPREAGRIPRDRLVVSQADLACAIAAAGPTTGLPTIIKEHALTSLMLACAGVRYLCQGAAVRDAYRRMTTAEFGRINARQAWANWRVIPRNLHGNLRIDRPSRVLDLCCGMGDSTRALAWWLPAGSFIVGMELDPRFAEAASAFRYRNRDGEIIPASIQRTSVLEGFRDCHGTRCADGSVDLVHAIGSIGCHFTPEQTAVILAECARVLADDGFAMLDAGRAGTSPKELTHVAQAHGFTVIGRARSWRFDRYEQLVLRRTA